MMKLERSVHDLFIERKLTLAVAESCAGGLISNRITDIPGSSVYFKGGVVAYSNDVKVRILKVPEKLIREHGAVSAAVAEAMADGARKALGADLAVSVTGIAGPSGGTAAKPVGLAYISLSSKQGMRSAKVRFRGGRAALKKKFADAALEFLVSNMMVKKSL